MDAQLQIKEEITDFEDSSLPLSQEIEVKNSDSNIVHQEEIVLQNLR